MRIHDDPIAVRLADSSDDPTGGRPAQFIWRRRLWRVLAVQRYWVEAGAWWDDPRVRRGRGRGDGPADPSGDDLLSERYVWRVEAAAGADENVGVYELACCGHDWQLRAVID